MAAAIASLTQEHHTPDPEALNRYLLSLSFPFVDVPETDEAEAYGLEPPPDVPATYLALPQVTLLSSRSTPASDDHAQDAWLPTPVLSATSSTAASVDSTAPSTPLLTPRVTPSALPLAAWPIDEHKVADYFSEHEHHTLSERILAWGANHLHVLEAFVKPHDDDVLKLHTAGEPATYSATCVPAPKTLGPNAMIEPAHPGAQVRFLIRPMPPKHEDDPLAAANSTLSPLVAAVAGGLFGFGENEHEFYGDDEYEFAEAEFGLLE